LWKTFLGGVSGLSVSSMEAEVRGKNENASKKREREERKIGKKKDDGDPRIPVTRSTSVGPMILVLLKILNPR